MVPISTEELRLFIHYIYQLCGVCLDESKGYLLESRLSPLIAELNCTSYRDLYNKAHGEASQSIANKIIDVVSTHETFFFRDRSCFDLLAYKLVPDYYNRVRPDAAGRFPALRIWSAACSTGQEVYSIAMTLNELLGDMSRYPIHILGTDISEAAVQQASAGQYNQVEIERGLSPEQISKYFVHDGRYWRIKDELRCLATFKTLNLLQAFAPIGTFDIVLCRNVAIYFSSEDRRHLFDRLSASLSSSGVLLLGATESLSGVSQRYQSRNHHDMTYYEVH